MNWISITVFIHEYTDLYMTRKRRKHDELFHFFQLKISIDEYNMLNMTRSRGWLISRWQGYWIMGTLTLALIYKYYVNMTELSYRTSPIKQYIYINHRQRKLSITKDEERVQSRPLEVYLYIYMYMYLWYCSAKWLQSDCTPDETIEFALIWSTAEVHQVVLSLASYMDT